jgi:hypothetical protein
MIDFIEFDIVARTLHASLGSVRRNRLKKASAPARAQTVSPI